MIEAIRLRKTFDTIVAVNNVDMCIRKGQVFGLLGTNGAGKSTLLRLMAGVLKPDSGTLLMDSNPIYENPIKKQEFFYISDEQYFFPNSTPADLRDYCAKIYPGFDKAGFLSLLASFDLDPKRRINTFSKGMKKQLSLFAGIAANTRYLFCDETFDGLDPVVRHAVKSLFADRMATRGLTPVITSHNLRELEDICDTVGLLHKGGLLLSRELVEMKQNIHKIQVVFRGEFSVDTCELDIVNYKESGSLLTLIIRGEEEAILAGLNEYRPIFMELLPLTLEEVFISETEVAGYEFKNLTL